MVVNVWPALHLSPRALFHAPFRFEIKQKLKTEKKKVKEEKKKKKQEEEQEKKKQSQVTDTQVVSGSVSRLPFGKKENVEMYRGGLTFQLYPCADLLTGDVP